MLTLQSELSNEDMNFPKKALLRNNRLCWFRTYETKLGKNVRNTYRPKHSRNVISEGEKYLLVNANCCFKCFEDIQLICAS
jgi:hypothetical protein